MCWHVVARAMLCGIVISLRTHGRDPLASGLPCFWAYAPSCARLCHGPPAAAMLLLSCHSVHGTAPSLWSISPISSHDCALGSRNTQDLICAPRADNRTELCITVARSSRSACTVLLAWCPLAAASLSCTACRRSVSGGNPAAMGDVPTATRGTRSLDQGHHRNGFQVCNMLLSIKGCTWY